MKGFGVLRLDLLMVAAGEKWEGGGAGDLGFVDGDERVWRRQGFRGLLKREKEARVLKGNVEISE